MLSTSLVATIQRNTRRRPAVICFALLKFSWINALCVYSANNNYKKAKRDDFIETISWELIRPQIQSRLEIPQVPIEIRKKGALLLKRKKTMTYFTFPRLIVKVLKQTKAVKNRIAKTNSVMILYLRQNVWKTKRQSTLYDGINFLSQVGWDSANRIWWHTSQVWGEARQVETILDTRPLLLGERLSPIGLYTNQYIDKIRPLFVRARNPRLTNLVEVKAFIGLFYLAGFYHASRLNLGDNGVELLRLTMSLSHFRFLMRCIRSDDSDTYSR